MPLATLSVDLEARLASLERGFDKAYRAAEKNASFMEARYAKVGATMASIGRTITAAFAGISVVAMVKGTTDALDALNDLKDATGSSIENLSALEDVALRTGTSYDSMAGALVKFNNTLKEAKPGSDAERVIKALGLDVEKLKALDPAEALRQVAVALSGYADDGDKARAVQELFGKSVREVAPFLADLAKQGQLNAKVTSEQAEAAERFNQQLAAMRKDVTDAARAIVGDMLPALSEFLRQLTEGRKAFGSFSSALFSLGTSRTFSTELEALRFYKDELEKAKGVVNDIETGVVVTAACATRATEQVEELWPAHRHHLSRPTTRAPTSMAVWTTHTAVPSGVRVTGSRPGRGGRTAGRRVDPRCTRHAIRARPRCRSG